jgi:tRNA-Thr(GGU) m(6)t(6)A37 methyltransferase TsaA
MNPERQMNTIVMEPIGVVRSSRTSVADDDWDREQAYIELDETRFDDDALAGLDLFSHVEVIFLMDRVDPAKIEIGSRFPRNNPAWPRLGIFAQRGKNRPNRIGLTVCRVLRVDGLRLHVMGLDAIDGSPVLDLKPWVQEFGPRGPVVQPEWMTELMEEYWSPQS